MSAFDPTRTSRPSTISGCTDRWATDHPRPSPSCRFQLNRRTLKPSGLSYNNWTTDQGQASYASDHPDAVADRSLPNIPLQCMTKVFISTAVYHAAKDAAELFGAMGVMRDMPPQRYINDVLNCLHSGNGNSNSDAKLEIAEALAGFRRR